MNWMDQSEEAYKNGYKAGFERGYTEGLGDRASELLDGAIRWHKRCPNEDLTFCFIVYRDEDGVTRVYAGRYFNAIKSFSIREDDMKHWGDIDVWDPHFVMWGEYRPVEFTSPGIDS